MSTKLCLIRHGHTDDNGGSASPALSGTNDVPLSNLGRREVALLTERLVREGRSFDVVYASPLVRAVDTALALVRAGLGPLQVVPALAEIHCGALEGLPIARVQQSYPELWQANLRQDDDDFCWPGGESYRAFRQRVWRTLCGLAEQNTGRSIAVVTHAGVISQLLGKSSGLRAAQWEPFRPGNTALTEVEWSGRGFTCRRFDDRCHLATADAVAQRSASG